MNYSNYRLTLDIKDVRSNAVVRVKRGNNTKRLCISLVDNGKVYQISDGCTAALKGKKPDGFSLYNECTIDDNTIYYVIGNNTTSTVGVVECEIVLVSGNEDVLISPTFIIIVEEVPVDDDDVIDSSDEVSALVALVSETTALKNEVETKLTNGEFDGKDGDTPYIGENGNWWIGDVDTGVRADIDVDSIQQELEDLRTGYEGTVYPTAGEAVREQIVNMGMSIGQVEQQAQNAQSAAENAKEAATRAGTLASNASSAASIAISRVPEATAADEGKVLKAVGGKWMPSEDGGAADLGDLPQKVDELDKSVGEVVDLARNIDSDVSQLDQKVKSLDETVSEAVELVNDFNEDLSDTNKRVTELEKNSANVTVDGALNPISANPVENRVVTDAIGKIDQKVAETISELQGFNKRLSDLEAAPGTLTVLFDGIEQVSHTAEQIYQHVSDGGCVVLRHQEWERLFALAFCDEGSARFVGITDEFEIVHIEIIDAQVYVNSIFLASAGTVSETLMRIEQLEQGLGSTVKYDSAQNLTDRQKQQARDNIDAAYRQEVDENSHKVDEALTRITELESKKHPTKVSELTNDSQYITKDGAPVQSVNGQTGAVALLAVDVGADKSGTAAAQVTAHNTSDAAHNDIRLIIDTIANRLNALANSTDTDLDQLAEVVAYIKANRDLIEQITTGKVSVADIVNNLTTNVTNKPLSAAQGVALKALIDAIVIPTKLSQLINDKGFLTGYTETDPTVPAWAKAASKPSYSKSEVGLGNVDNVKQYSASNPPPYPVTSVNGEKGDVIVPVPTKTSQLTNDSNFLTAHQDISGKANKSDAETWTFTLEDGSTVTKKVVLA